MRMILALMMCVGCDAKEPSAQPAAVTAAPRATSDGHRIVQVPVALWCSEDRLTKNIGFCDVDQFACERLEQVWDRERGHSSGGCREADEVTCFMTRMKGDRNQEARCFPTTTQCDYQIARASFDSDQFIDGSCFVAHYDSSKR